jgi:hypothetical protein
MERCDMTGLELIVVVAQKIWFCRNGVVHGGVFTHPQQLVREANMSLNDFRRATATDLAAISPIHIYSPLLWKPPTTGIYKVNGDATMDKKNGRIGFSIVVRDFEGVVLAVHSITKNFLV